MFKDLPNEIDPRVVSKFDAGSVEGPEDRLLWDCFCAIDPIDRFLDGTKDILLGDKGAGKSSVFSLIQRKKIKFSNPGNLDQIIIKIDQQLEYSKLKALLIKHLQSDIEDEDIRYRFLWEIYILYRISLHLKDLGLLDAEDEKVQKEVDDFIAYFSGEKKAPTLMQLLGATKKTFGVKINASNPAFPVPDAYVSFEPSANRNAAAIEPLSVDIFEIKSKLNRCLRRSKSVVYVLIDNIDDFVAREEYKIQKLLLQGLLQTAKEYSQHSHIKIKLFLRTDLYKKLNFSQLGGVDKMTPRTIELKWSSQNIREFIGERILYNLSRQLGIRKFHYVSDQEDILMDRKDKAEAAWWKRLVLLLGRMPLLKRYVERRLLVDERTAKEIGTKDELWRGVITMLFPRTIAHYDDHGERKEMDIFKYIETHFSLAGEQTTPRIVLLFLNKVFSISAVYYSGNPDQNRISLDARAEYPVIKREHVLQAYCELQADMLEIFKSAITQKEWRDMLDIFFQKKKKKSQFSFKSIKNMVGVESEESMKEFLAYLCHLGVLRCRDDSERTSERIYDLPILLQHIWK